MSSVYGIFGINVDPDEVDILYQKYDAETGITDIEMTDGQTFHLIIEAKSNLQSIHFEAILERKQFIIKPLYLCQNV